MHDSLHERPKSLISDQLVNVTASPSVICQADFNREALIIANPNGSDILVGWSNKVSATSGILIRQTDRPLVLSTLLHGGLVQYALWAVSAAPATVLISASSYHLCLADKLKMSR